MTVTPASEKLHNGTKVIYGVADLGIQALTAAIQFWMLFFFTDVAHIDPGLAGTALMVGKLTWDAINDPLFGYLSDKTRSRWGRRRPWMLLGAIPLGLATWLLFSLPEGLVGVKAFVAVLVSFLLFDTFHSAVSIAYYALTPELTYDYRERTSLTTVREVFTVLGYIVGAGITKMVADIIQANFGLTTSQSWSAVGATFGLVAIITILTTAINIKERKRADFVPSKMPPFKMFKTTFKNKPFMQLMAAQLLSSFSFTLLTTLLSYYTIYQVKMESQLTLIMLLLLGCIGIFLFPWRYLSDKINKGPCYALGLGIASLAVIFTFFFPNAPTPLLFVVVAVAGLGFSAQWVFPWSMLPDVIEYDQVMTGERHEGIYYGMWQFLGKFTGALGIAASGWALKLFGYVANQPQQTEQALLGIRLFFGPVPAIVLLISLPLLIWYPITRKTHAKLLEQIAAQAAEKASSVETEVQA
jgi:GPH family glycoside/pentoside/hexuronide:cation symporter